MYTTPSRRELLAAQQSLIIVVPGRIQCLIRPIKSLSRSVMHGDQECSASTPLHATKHNVSDYTFSFRIYFNWFRWLPPHYFRFLFYEVQCDLPTKLKPITRSVCSIRSSFRIALYGTFSIMWYIRTMISSSVCLLLLNHEECPRLRVPLHRWPRLPFPHPQRYLSMTLSLLQRDMLPHVGQSISLFTSPHSCKNVTPFSRSENKNPKNTVVRKPSAPTTLRPKDPLGMKGKFFISSW